MYSSYNSTSEINYNPSSSEIIRALQEVISQSGITPPGDIDQEKIVRFLTMVFINFDGGVTYANE